MMKYKLHLLVLAMIATVAVSCAKKEQKSMSIEVPLTNDGKVDTSQLPKFTFINDTYDFGQIKQGEKVSYSFKFKNTGNTPLIISSASASCGCTVPSYPEEPIQPGEESKIDVVFDSNGKMGMQTKTITLVANTIPNTKVLYLRGEITN
jgi:hypothetical protein